MRRKTPWHPGPQREKGHGSQSSHPLRYPSRPSSCSPHRNQGPHVAPESYSSDKTPLLAKELTSQPPAQNFRYATLPQAGEAMA